MTKKPLLTVAISSRALFDLDYSNKIFEEDGVKAYSEYQIKNENNPLKPGVAFYIIKKLLHLNSYHNNKHLVEVVLLSRNSADSGLRIFNSIDHHNLNITRAVFTRGSPVFQYAKAFGAHLFLSSNESDVKNALEMNCAAALIYSKNKKFIDKSGPLKIAFDGDSVIFSNESEKIFKNKGLEEFVQNEKKLANTPMSAGPFKEFLIALQKIQHLTIKENKTSPIRTALITARSAPTHERIIKTFRKWNIIIDESIFLGGLEKSDFIKAFNADIYFDDQTIHLVDDGNSALCHVPQH